MVLPPYFYSLRFAITYGSWTLVVSMLFGLICKEHFVAKQLLFFCKASTIVFTQLLHYTVVFTIGHWSLYSIRVLESSL